MYKATKGRRWVYVLIFFLFMLFHQFDVVLLNPVINQISAAYNVLREQLQPVFTLAIWVGAAFFLLWGWGYDRFNRKIILVYAGFVWGVTSLLIGISPTFVTFSVSYVLSAIDNAAYSGIFTMVSDYFNPKQRGKIYGLLHTSQPIALLGGILLTNILNKDTNWRLMLLGAGLVAFTMMLLVAIGIKEPKRGESEPAMQGINVSGIFLLDGERIRGLFKRRGLMLLFLVGLFAIMPWTAITTWTVSFLQNVHGLTVEEIYFILFPALTALTLGYPIGGLIGDHLFKISRRGRVVISLIGVALSILFLLLSFLMTSFRGTPFILMMMFTGLFMALERPNVIAMVFDMTLPELRSTSISIMMLFQLIGSIIGPILVGFLIPFTGLRNGLLWVSVGAWLISLFLLMSVYCLMPHEIEWLRKQMAYRSQLEKQIQTRKVD
jgi:MFS transporter, Spinster family, sphingosine-1-phosphate transporter